MAQTQGKLAHGVKFYIGDGASPEVYTLIPECRVMPPVGGRTPLVDMSNHDTIAFRDYLPGALADGSELTVEFNEIPGNAAQNLVRTAYAAREPVNWRVEYFQGATEDFPAIVIGRPETDVSNMEEGQVFRFILKISGDVVRTDP